MRCKAVTALCRTVLCLCATLVRAQQPAPQEAAKTPPDPIATLASGLSLERYKATIKSLTQFGDRVQGTDRNRAAVDWIEAQLKSYGCTNTERLHYDYQPPAPPATPAPLVQCRSLRSWGQQISGPRTPDPPQIQIR